MANWAHRTSPKFTTKVKSGFLTRSEIRKSQLPCAPKETLMKHLSNVEYCLTTNKLDFRESEGSLTPLHKPAIVPYLQQNYHIPRITTHLPQTHFNIIYVSASLKVSFLQVFPLKLCIHFRMAPCGIFSFVIKFI